MKRKVRVFISYSSKDRKAAETVHERFAAAGFEVWRDQTRLETDWSREIASALSFSDILCLLWTEHSASSKWVKHEWLTARALEKQIIPCLFPKAPNLPKPIYNFHGVTFPSLDEGLKQLIDRVHKEKLLTAKYDYTILPGNSYIPFNPNPLFTGRHADMLDLYLKMIGNLNKIGINQVGTVGMGGIGKTQLAVEFALRFSFGFQAIYWIQAAEPNNWANEFISLARDRLKLKVEDPSTPQAGRQYIFALQDYLKKHPNTLVVMDNVSEPKLLNNDTYLFGITPLTLGCDLLFTTRRHFQLPGVSSQPVNVLSPHAAYDLLKSYRAPETPEEESHARSICNSVGYLPLAITLAGSYLRTYKEISFGDYSEELAKDKLGSIDIYNLSEEILATRHVAALEKTLHDQWAMLKDEDARLLFRLAGQFSEAAIIPNERLGLLSGIKHGRSKLDQPLAKVMNHLHDLCLVERLEGNTHSARLHPLVREFAYRLIPHEECDAFRAAAAGRLKDAYFDYPRLEAEIERRGVQQVIDDMQVGLDWWGMYGEPKQDLALLHGALRLSNHVLSHEPAQLASQLVGRLILRASPGIQALLARIKITKQGTWLHPYTASMIPAGGPLICTLHGHTRSVTAVAATPYGKVVSGSYDNTLKVWDIESSECLLTLKGFAVDAIAINPDGKVVSGSYDNMLKVWDNESSEYFRILKGFAVNAIAVTQDGKAVFGSYNNTLEVWDLESGKWLHTLKGHTDAVTAVAVSPDGKAVSVSYDRTLKVWDLESGDCLRTLVGYIQRGSAVAVTPDGKVVSASDGYSLKVWDIESGEYLRTLEGHTGAVSAVAVTPDGKAVSGSYDRTLKVWDLESGDCLRTLVGYIQRGSAVAVTPNGKVVSVSEDNTLMVWDIESGECLRTLEGHTGSVNGLAVTPDGNVVSASDDNTLKVWDIGSEVYLRTLEGHTSSVYAVAVTPEGKVVSGSDDDTLKVWDLESGECLRTLKGHTASVNAVAITPDGKVVTGSLDKTLKVYDLESGECLSSQIGHINPVTAIVGTHDGKVVSGSLDKTLKVWDIELGQCLDTFEGHTGGVKTVAVTLDGKVVSGSQDNTLKVWDLESGECLRTLKGHTGSVNAVAVTPDGKVVSASGDYTLKVWEIESGECLHTLKGHTDAVSAVAVIPDGKVVSGSCDQSLKVWNIGSGMVLASFTGDTAMNACTVATDGRTIVAGDASGHVHFLRLEIPGTETI